MQDDWKVLFLPGKHVFYFAKINVHGKIEDENLQNIINTEIPRVINNATDLKMGKSTISFTDIKEITFENNTFIRGNLTTSKKENLRVKDGKQTYLEKSNKELANSAMFIYDIKSEILAFETISNINEKKFIEFFTKLLSQDPKVGEVKINIIPEDYKIVQELIIPDKIKSIEFSLIKPNPRARQYNTYNQIINETGAKKATVKIEDDKDGLDIDINEDGEIKTKSIDDGIELVEKGYGTVKISSESYTRVPSGTKRKTTRKIVKRNRFNSSKSHKFRTFNNVFQLDLVSSILNFIEVNILNKKDK